MSRSIELGTRSADARMRQSASPAQHLLADRHADALLELEAHEGRVAIEEIGRFVLFAVIPQGKRS